jgi:hypothetical protein
MVASWFEAEDPEDQAKGEPGLGALDGTEDVRLGSALRESSASEVEPGHPEQSQQEANDGGENSGAPVKPRDMLKEALPVLLQGLDGDDRADAPPLPGPYCGAGDCKAAAQRRRAGTHHVLAETMVVGAPRPGCPWKAGDHAGRFTQGSPAAKS